MAERKNRSLNGIYFTCPFLIIEIFFTVLREGCISPYNKNILQPHVNYIEEELDVYSFFLKEYDDYVVHSLEPRDEIWNMNFDGVGLC